MQGYDPNIERIFDYIGTRLDGTGQFVGGDPMDIPEVLMNLGPQANVKTGQIAGQPPPAAPPTAAPALPTTPGKWEGWSFKKVP
jgi:hypothetical protein